MIPPPPCDSMTWKAELERRNGETLTVCPKRPELDKEYFLACQKVSQDRAVDFVDLWESFDKKPECFSDGLHFSKIGSQVLFNLLWPKIEAKAPKIINFPEWKDLYN